MEVLRFYLIQLEHDRCFLQPLYKFHSVTDRRATQMLRQLSVHVPNFHIILGNCDNEIVVHDDGLVLAEVSMLHALALGLSLSVLKASGAQSPSLLKLALL